MSQTRAFKLANKVIFSENGTTRRQRATMMANHKVIVAALGNREALFKLRNASCLELLYADKQGWRTTVIGSESSGVVANKQVLTCTVRKLAFYGKHTNLGFKVTDNRLKALWYAFVSFVEVYGTKIGLTGDLEMQQASMLYTYYQKYVAYQEAKAAARAVDDARKAHEQELKVAEEKSKTEELLKKKKKDKEAAEKEAAEKEAIELAKKAGEELDSWEDLFDEDEDTDEAVEETLTQPAMVRPRTRRRLASATTERGRSIGTGGTPFGVLH